MQRYEIGIIRAGTVVGITKRLGVSRHTIQGRLANVFQELGVLSDPKTYQVGARLCRVPRSANRGLSIPTISRKT